MICGAAETNLPGSKFERVAARLIRQDRIRTAKRWPKGRNPWMDGVTAERMDARSNRAPGKQSLRQFQRKTPRKSRSPRLCQWGRENKLCVAWQRLDYAFHAVDMIPGHRPINLLKINLSPYSLIRYCDDFVCAFQYRSDADAFYRVLPKRLAKFNLEVAPEKTQIIRFSRFHHGLKRRFSFLGFEFYWGIDRTGKPRLSKRTDRKRLSTAIKSFTAWLKSHRHLKPGLLLAAVSSKLKGHYNYYGMPGNYRSIRVFYDEAIKNLFKWLQRRSRKDRINGYRFYGWLDYFRVPTPKVVPLPKVRNVML